MAKKSKLIVYGGVSGEGIVYETCDDSRFEIKTQVINQVTVNNKSKEYANNPKLVTEVLQVVPVDAKSLEPVAYYSADTPKPGHKFLVAQTNDVVDFMAIVRYNKSQGHITNKLKAIRFEVIDLKSHKELLQEFTTLSALYSSKRPSLYHSTKYFRVCGNGIDKNSALYYSYIEQDSETLHKILYGTTQYTETTVAIILALNGIWSKGDKNEYKRGNFKSYLASCSGDTTTIGNFLLQLQTISLGRLSIPEGRVKKFAEFWFSWVHTDGNTFDCTRVLNFLTNNPNKAFGTSCPVCKRVIDSYFNRIDQIGKEGSTETWKKVYSDMSKEPGF